MGYDRQTERWSHYRRVYAGLVEAYGEPRWQAHLPAVDELIATILSQATSDTNRDRGFTELKRRFPDWDAVMKAPISAVRAAIFSAGLANQKAPRIQAALQTIHRERGVIELEFLRDWPVEVARAWLMQIKGVGMKTASIVLLFSFGRPVFPVDTHVHRILRRLGLIGPGVSPEQAHREIEALAPPAHFYPLHLNLIRHGRSTCLARRPRCDACPLRPDCTYYADLDA